MKKSGKILLILAFVVLLGLIHMPNKAFAAEDGEVVSINIGANAGDSVSSVNLYLEDHETEQLKTTIKVWKNDEIVEDNSIQANWSSSDESVVTVSSTGLLTAKKEGTATITATLGDKSEKVEVKVNKIPVSADFSNAEYKWNTGDTHALNYLKIEGNVNWDVIEDYSLYYTITSDNKQPQIIIDGPDIFADNNGSKWEKFSQDYGAELSKYLALNQDIYIWLLQKKDLYKDGYGGYYKEDGTKVTENYDFVVSGKKIEKFSLPVYSGLFFATFVSADNTQIVFNAPKENGKAEQRKFSIKIGKILDNSILKAIKDEENDSFAKLENYAKSNEPILEKVYETNNNMGLAYDDIDGENTEILPLDNKLINDEYYYMYISFDDENGKYAPIEHCLTLGQAYVLDSGMWSIHFYGTSDFKWKEFSTENTGGDYTPTRVDQTISTTSLPHTGISYAIIGIISILGVASIVFYFKNNKYKGI